MRTLQTVRDEIQALCDTGEAILAVASKENRELSAEEQAQLDEIYGVDGKAGQIDMKKKEADRLERVEKERAEIIAKRASAQGRFKDEETTEPAKMAVKVPATAKRKPKYFATEEDGYKSGMFLAAVALEGKPQGVHARQWCEDHGVIAAHSTIDNEKGGYGVPEEFNNAVIRLVEQFGVFRQNAYNWPMSSMTAVVPRRTGGLTVYYPEENSEVTASDITLNQVKLKAGMMAALTTVSAQLSITEAIGLADLIALEFAQSFAYAEDNNGFNGDGTSTYGGVEGLKNRLLAGSVVDAASGNNSVATLDFADFRKVVGKLPEFPGIMPRWYMHKTVFHGACGRLMDALGGNANAELAAGLPPTFMGYPVVFAQAMPAESAVSSSTICAYFGDLSMAATFGSLRGMAVSSDGGGEYFKKNQIAIKATQLYDINVHEIGTASAAGPILALKTAS